MEYLDHSGLTALWTKITNDFTHSLTYDPDSSAGTPVPKLVLTRTTHTPSGNTEHVLSTITQATGRTWLGLGTMAYENLVNGKIPMSLFPDAILGQMVYGGIVSPSSDPSITTATAYLTDAARYKLSLPAGTDHISLTPDNTTTTGYVSNQGIYYIVQGSGTFATLDLNTGDWLVATSTAWRKVDNTDAVTSVNGSTGVVSLGLEAGTSTNANKIRITGATPSSWFTVPFATNTSKLGGQDPSHYENVIEKISISGTDQAPVDKRITFAVNGTYDPAVGHETYNPLATVSTVTTAIGNLDVNALSLGQGETIASIAESDGLISVTKQSIQITKSQVTGYPTTVGSHSLPIYFDNTVATVIDSLSVPGDIQSAAGGVSAYGIADLSLSTGGGIGTVTYIKLGGSGNPIGPDSNGIVTIPQATSGVSGVDGYMSTADKTRVDRTRLGLIYTTSVLTGFEVHGEDSSHAEVDIYMNAIPASDINALS